MGGAFYQVITSCKETPLYHRVWRVLHWRYPEPSKSSIYLIIEKAWFHSKNVCEAYVLTLVWEGRDLLFCKGTMYMQCVWFCLYLFELYLFLAALCRSCTGYINTRKLTCVHLICRWMVIRTMSRLPTMLMDHICIRVINGHDRPRRAPPPPQIMNALTYKYWICWAWHTHCQLFIHFCSSCAEGCAHCSLAGRGALPALQIWFSAVPLHTYTWALPATSISVWRVWTSISCNGHWCSWMSITFANSLLQQR